MPVPQTYYGPRRLILDHRAFFLATQGALTTVKEDVRIAYDHLFKAKKRIDVAWESLERMEKLNDSLGQHLGYDEHLEQQFQHDNPMECWFIETEFTVDSFLETQHLETAGYPSVEGVGNAGDSNARPEEVVGSMGTVSGTSHPASSFYPTFGATAEQELANYVSDREVQFPGGTDGFFGKGKHPHAEQAGGSEQRNPSGKASSAGDEPMEAPWRWSGKHHKKPEPKWKGH